jgi:hypothetical protein
MCRSACFLLGRNKHWFGWYVSFDCPMLVGKIIKKGAGSSPQLIFILLK